MGFYFIFLKKTIYLRARERQESVSRGGTEGEGQTDSTLSMEPDAGLDSMTLRS